MSIKKTLSRVIYIKLQFTYNLIASSLNFKFAVVSHIFILYNHIKTSTYFLLDNIKPRIINSIFIVDL